MFERYQILLYLGAAAVGVVVAAVYPHSIHWQGAISPAIAFMLFVTFLQLPMLTLGRQFMQPRFFASLFVANFIVVPLLVALLRPFMPSEPLVRFGMLLVLLAPCIDYVVSFAHQGKADARSLLAATPALLLLQMVLLPVYLYGLQGATAWKLFQISPFVQAFVAMILVPLLLALIIQHGAKRHAWVAQAVRGTDQWPVLATSLVLFIVVAAVMPQLQIAAALAKQLIPYYLLFALVSPVLGWGVARLARLGVKQRRAIAFSAATRNSLVILPLAWAVPEGAPILPVVIITQTLIELLASIIYMRLMPRLGGSS